MTETSAPKLYTVRYQCDHTVRVPYARTIHLGAANRNAAGEFASVNDCPPCMKAQAAASISWTISYETAAPGRAHGTPEDGWYPSESKSLTAGSERIILNAAGEVDWKATSSGLLTRWFRLNGGYAGRVRFLGWQPQQGSPRTADYERIVTTA